MFVYVEYSINFKLMFVVFCSSSYILGGQGVPPGTKREKCKACNGSGMVSIMLQNSSLAIVIMIFFLIKKWFLR